MPETPPLPPSARRLLVIYNPTAGWRRRRRCRQVLAELERLGCALTLRETAARGDAERFARAADPATVDLVVAAGGDGTINEVINGLADSPLPLGILPLGTANVLAAEIGLSGPPRAIAAALAAGRPRPVHLGSANGRRFALMVGVGFDARVVEGLDLRLKRALGKLAYALAALRQLWGYSAERYEIEIDGRSYTAAAVVIAKGRYYGGRFSVAPEARLETPCLYVALFSGPGRWNLIRYAWGLLSGRMNRLGDVQVIPAHSVSVKGAPGEAVQADGDLIASLPLAVTLAERPLALVTG